MTSFPIRDQVSDHLLTPKNAALVIIDYQPTQFADIASMDRQLLADNIVRVATIGKVFGLPIVLSTVNVKLNSLKPTIPPLRRQCEADDKAKRPVGLVGSIRKAASRAFSGGPAKSVLQSNWAIV